MPFKMLNGVLYLQMPEPIHFKVPVGQKEQENVVVAGTLFVTVLATLVMCAVIWNSNSHDKSD